MMMSLETLKISFALDIKLFEESVSREIGTEGYAIQGVALGLFAKRGFRGALTFAVLSGVAFFVALCADTFIGLGHALAGFAVNNPTVRPGSNEYFVETSAGQIIIHIVYSFLFSIAMQWALSRRLLSNGHSFAAIICLCCVAFAQFACSASETRINPTSKKTLVYSINNGPESRMTLDGSTPGELNFNLGDRLKVIALEFPIGSSDKLNQDGKKMRLQVEVMRYIVFEMPDTWDAPQPGEWFIAQNGNNRANGNGHEWVLAKDHNYMSVAIVDDSSGSMQEDNFSPLCDVQIVLLAPQKSMIQWRVERNPYNYFQTKYPAIITVTTWLAVGIAGFLILVIIWTSLRKKMTAK
jgi:hypothetical protein